MSSSRRYGLLVDDCEKEVPLKESKIKLTVQGFIASVECQLTYLNDTSDPLQTSYVFPMDDMSAVYKFEADVNNKHIIAECQDKKKAKETYNEAISSGHTAMLLSEDDTAGDIFECKLGNLPARETAVLTMGYVTELSVEPEGKMRFTLPAVLKPRYFPDVGHLVETGSEPTFDRVDIKTPGTLTFSASISGRHKIKAITSSNDKLIVSIGDDALSATVQLAEEFNFEHDLSLDIMYEDIKKPEVIVEMGDPNKDGLLKEDVLMMNFYPDLKQGEETEDSKREFIFVIDRSGSMGGDRIQKAKETLLLLLKSLPVGCLFNVVSFGSSHSSLFKQSEEYTEKTLKQATDLQKKIDADMGGTEILQPLESIYSQSCKQCYPRQIFLLTDGGVGNTNEVISLVRKNKGNTRVFTFGIGEGASTSLIKNVAKASNGKSIFIKDKDNMQAKVISAMKGSLDNCLSEVQIEWKIPKCFTVLDIPSEPPVIFHGEKLVLFALLKSSDNKQGVSGSLVIKGTFGGKTVSYNVTIEAPSNTHQDLPIHRVAAKYQIKDLENNDDSSYGQDRANKDRIVLVSQAANIVSKYTAFVGVDKETKVPVSVLEEPYHDDIEYNLHTRIQSLGGTRQLSVNIDKILDRSDKLCDLNDKSEHLTLCSTEFKMSCGMAYTQSNSLCAAPSSKKKKSAGFSMPSFSMSSFFKSKSKGISIKKMRRNAPPPPALNVERSAPPPLSSKSRAMPISDCLDSDETEELEDRCNSIKSTQDVMMQIVSLQNFDGSWSPSDKLAQILQITEKELKSKFKGTGNILCTAIVIVFLETNFYKHHSEWEMIKTKAIKWMSSQDKGGKSVEEIIQEVKDSKTVKTL